MLSILFALQVAVATPAPGDSIQAQFDRASAAYAAGQFEAAAAGYDALEKRLTGKNAASLALARARRGSALYKLERLDEARPLLAEALPVLAAKPNLAGEAHDAAMFLGAVAFRDLDLPASATAYGIALKTAASDREKIEALPLLARALMFEGDGRALDYANQAITLAEADKGFPEDRLAELQTIKARALLNGGDAKGALAAVREAIKLQGGLHLKTSLREVATRSDAGIAAMLAGDKEAARQYLAYTGAGRIEKAPFASALDMSPPACGGDADIRPEDTAVVEFGITDQGTVDYAVPIYASRPGPIAAAFAGAVRDWVWRPEQIRSVPEFYKVLTRVELRCSNAFDTPSIVDFISSDLRTWLEGKAVAPAPSGARSAPEIAALRTELQRRLAAGGGDGLQGVPIQIRLGTSPLLSFEERRTLLIAARDALVRASAPVAGRTTVEVFLAGASSDDRQAAEAIAALLTQPDVAAEPRLATAIRLLAVERGGSQMPSAQRLDLLTTAANDDRLPPRDPLRVGAWVRLASEQARGKNLEAARSSYDRSGLDVNQCALVDARQALTRTGATSNDYPLAAQQWGFEGWARAEFDIAADGHTLNQRAIISYPPFIFDQATVGILRDARYEQVYRPAGALGCTSKGQTVSFVLDKGR
jgi:tetratricopeptide (TPR) repeat protein